MFVVVIKVEEVQKASDDECLGLAEFETREEAEDLVLWLEDSAYDYMSV